MLLFIQLRIDSSRFCFADCSLLSFMLSRISSNAFPKTSFGPNGSYTAEKSCLPTSSANAAVRPKPSISLFTSALTISV